MEIEDEMALFNFEPNKEDPFIADDDDSLEFSMGDFNVSAEAPEQKTRIIKPKFSSKPITVDYANAAALARQIRLFPGEQIHGFVRGDFIFGDFIEALLSEKQAVAQEAYISTLSLSQNNIDSLAGLMQDGLIERLTLMVSNYYYSHERNGLMRYLLGELDIDNRFQCLVCRNHTKITLLSISNLRLITTGSSNLRSSQSIEQFCLQESAELYDFYKTLFTTHEANGIIDMEVSR